MSEAIIITIIGGIVTIISAPSIWGFIKSRKDEPLRHKESERAEEHQDEQMALSYAKDAREDARQAREHAKWIATRLEQVTTEVINERDHRRQLGDRVCKQEAHTRQQDQKIGQLERVIQVFSDAWDDLIENWSIYRQRDEPPPRPHSK